MVKPSAPGSMQSRRTAEGFSLAGEEVGECGVAIRFMVGAIAFGLKVEKQTLGEVFFVFDEDDEGSGLGHMD